MLSSPTVPPTQRPRSPGFSCGPAAKFGTWSARALEKALVGRSHRSAVGRARIAQMHRAIHDSLNLPKDYVVATLPGSDTGAVEAALWNLLGPRPVDVFGWEAFGNDWVTDVVEQLVDVPSRGFIGAYGTLPDLTQANPDHDIVFSWNGTAAGVKAPDDAAWIKDDHAGLVICDATSAVWALPIPWHKLDVITFSWQKMSGSEPAHGTMILSPRAIERLETYQPTWPIPKIYRLTKGGKVLPGLFEGDTINTPSLLCVEDMLAALAWLDANGGVAGAQARARESFRIISAWVEKTPWIDFLPADPAVRSPVSVCLRLTDPTLGQRPWDEQRAFCANLIALVESEGAGYDFNAYKEAPPGLRIWCGATVMPEDVTLLLPWIDWAFARCYANIKAAA